MHFETKAIHAGGAIDEPTGSVAPPIHLSTTFERDPDGTTPRGYSYIREGNPTQTRLEETLAAIDSAEAALAFASGMSAGTALLQSLRPGSHVLLPDDSYYGFAALGREYFPKWGMSADFVAMEDVEAVRRAIRPETTMIWSESPSNPLLKVVDLAALTEIARGQGALMV